MPSQIAINLKALYTVPTGTILHIWFNHPDVPGAPDPIAEVNAAEVAKGLEGISALIQKRQPLRAFP